MSDQPYLTVEDHNRDVSGMIMHGMQLSVMCGEDVPDLAADPFAAPWCAPSGARSAAAP